MMLTTATTQEFQAGDRRRGSEIDTASHVEFLDVGNLGLKALVNGSQNIRYLVTLDFEILEDGDLGVSCQCPRFDDGFACKHLWATLEKFDQVYDSPLNRPTSLELYEVDPDDFSVGTPITPSHHSNNNTGPRNRKNGRRKSTNSKRAAQPNWLTQLGQITRSTGSPGRDRQFGLPADLLPSSAHRSQHWFVLSISDPANVNELQLVAMRSTRKNDGNWGRPVAVELTTQDIVDITDEKESQAIALLQPKRDQGFRDAYSYYRSGHRLFSVDPALLAETLKALHGSARLAWKLGDSKQHFEDARPVDGLSIQQHATLRLSIAPNPQKKSELVVSPQVVTWNDAAPTTNNTASHATDTSNEFTCYSIEQTIWVSRIGCALLQECDPDLPQQLPVDSDDVTTTDDASTAGVVAGHSQYCNQEHQSESPIRTRLVTLSPHDCTVLQSWRSTKTLRVPRRSLRSLLRELSVACGNIELEIDSSLEQDESTDDPVAICLLQQNEPRATDFVVTMSARYPNREIAFDSPLKWWFDENCNTVRHRNLDSERRWLSTINTNDFGYSANGSQWDVKLPPERFLAVVETLRNSGWEVTANGAPIRVASNFDVIVSSGVDWFDLDAEVSFDGIGANLPELLDAIKQGQQTIALDDGTVGMLPTEWLSKFAGIRESGKVVDGSVRFHRSQGLLLDLMLEDLPEANRDRDYSTFLRQLKNFEGIKPAEPKKTFSGELRDYQRDGLGWFGFLQKFQFGGCLADDMGLGKTIQVLALLDGRRTRRPPKDEKRKPSIVVAPKSLIFNWLDEAAKFTPKLRVRNHTGSERKADWDELSENPDSIDVLLTTYGTMRIDAPLLTQLEFDYAILDEAQAIKNPNSLAARASRLLNAEHRLAMTGTPVENHLGDLWSLFSFLNPGMLSNSSATPSRLPDLNDQTQRQHVEKIGKSLRPFILRRTKNEVLSELPEKTEQTLACSMSNKQRKLYDGLREHYRIHLSNKVKELGLKKAKIHVLEALLRLRQAACDPRLVDPECGVRGAKIDELLERLEELRQEGRKALVFSQFTSLLSLLKQDLDKRGWNYEYLDGKTRRRGDKVQRFQTDPDCQLFLISLKAGGNGLNLTAAEYVFILDPWWNPAVEAQAIDRAHRMGQTQSVNAYRMICEGTVESKIIELQQSKRNLADAIVSQNKSVIGQLTASDLQDLLG